MKKLHPFHLLLVATLAVGGAAAAVAQTPDGIPPANEGVCDELIGKTPGLYGLCVAFCEATDCDPDFSAPNPFAECRPSGPKLLANYRKKMQAGDPDMPCLRAPCPCWSPQELAALRVRNGATDAPDWTTPGDMGPGCVVDFNGQPPFLGGPPDGAHVANGDFWVINNASLTYLTAAGTVLSIDEEGPACFLVDFCDAASGPCLNAQRFFEIDHGQLAGCEADIAASGATRSFDCFSTP